MARGRTVTLKGDAAKAFIDMQSGKKPKTEYDELLQVATAVHMRMQAGNGGNAMAVLKLWKAGKLEP